MFNCGGIIDLKDNMQEKLGHLPSGAASVEEVRLPIGGREQGRGARVACVNASAHVRA